MKQGYKHDALIIHILFLLSVLLLPVLQYYITAYCMGSLGHTLQIDLPRDWVNLALYRDV